MSGNDCLGVFYEKHQKNVAFHYFEGRQREQGLKIPPPTPQRRAQTRTHFIRSIAPRVLIPHSITLVRVLSGIHQNPSVQALLGE